MSIRGRVPAWPCLWLAVALAALWARPLLPLSETRLVSVAWEMWTAGDYLVPHLNGQPYSDKPPLLFWLVHAGWCLFGVKQWWPRLLPLLFGVATLWAVGHLARMLWPADERAARMAPLLTLAGAFWSILATVIITDVLLVFFVLVGLAGLVHAWRCRGWRGWMVAAAGMGFGLLAKGPVVLLHVVPVGLLAPWWAAGPGRPVWRAWYRGLAGAALLGGATALAWGLAAGRAGGPDYERAILWGQTAGRITHSFAHGRPWWWYLPWVPVLLFPAVLWFPLWRALGRLLRSPVDAGVRFCLAYLVLVFFAFSLISGKQPHYLLPAVPVFAVLASRALSVCPRAPRAAERMVLGAILALLGLAGVLMPFVQELNAAWTGWRLPSFFAWATAVSPVPGLLLLLGGIGFAAVRVRDHERSVLALALAVVATVVLLHVAARPILAARYDLTPVSRYLHGLETAGYPVAHLGHYKGQYHFLGRLRRPLELISAAAASGWIARHPNGRVVTYDRAWQAGQRPGPEYAQPHRGDNVLIWRAESLPAHYAAVGPSPWGRDARVGSP